MMFGFLAAGPNPALMSCEDIIKGYKKNKDLAETRSPKHRQQHLTRVQELKPYYENCIAQQGAAPVVSQGAEMQAVFDKIYESGGAPGTGPLAMSATATAPAASPINASSLLLLAGIGVGVIVLVTVMKRRTQ